MIHSFKVCILKRMVLIFSLSISFFIISIFADFNAFRTTNYFPSLSEEINFGRLLPIPFKYTVSSCENSFDCGHTLFDNNRSTNWVSKSESETESVLIDFYSKRLMNGIFWEFSDSTTTILEIQIQVFYRGEWKTLQTVSMPALKGILEFASTDASLLKVNFLKENKSSLILKNLSVLLNDASLTTIPLRLMGYGLPVANALLPEDDYSLPGAPRKYRNGIHKGLDINYFTGSDFTEQKIKMNTPIYAIQSGEIVRVDLDYQPITLTEHSEITQYNQSHPVTYVEKDFGGRQIWIDHKNGVMSSYNHLSSITPNIKIGGRVVKGEIIGYAGNSGLLAEAKSTKEQIHLHLEIWIDGEFLGNDLKPSQSKKFLQFFFSE
jgi:murein DD-endopeptidase MepM/ murein hydrolase activator NlpD